MHSARKRFDYENKKDISIIAVNCIGGEVYSILGLPFRSPMINTAMNRKQYITMCENLNEYMFSELNVSKDEHGICFGYLKPEGLPSVKIRFDHDTDTTEIKEKWIRRVKRINWKQIVLICDDKDIDASDYMRFDRITEYKKIMFTAADLSKKYSWCYQLKKYSGHKATGTYNGKSLAGGWKFQFMWDFVEFLNS